MFSPRRKTALLASVKGFTVWGETPTFKNDLGGSEAANMVMLTNSWLVVHAGG